MAHADAQKGKWRGNWRKEWLVSTLHTTSELSVSSITTADAHNSAASSQLNWRPCWFNRTRPFRRKTKAGICACAITFQTQSTYLTDQSCCTQLAAFSGLGLAVSLHTFLDRPFGLCRWLCSGVSELPSKYVCWPLLDEGQFWKETRILLKQIVKI